MGPSTPSPPIDPALLATWPLFGLEVRTPRLSLRYPSDADLAALGALSGDIHDPDEMPFNVAWSRRPDGVRERSILQYHWRARSLWTPEDWELLLVAVVDGAVVGTQGMEGTHWGARRTVATGSWLHRPRQGQGLGTEMRHAVLHLAFAGLGARRAETDAFAWNRASQGVTEKLGYRRNGDHLAPGLEPGDPPRLTLAYVLDRETWAARRRDDIEVVGLEPCLDLFAPAVPSEGSSEGAPEGASEGSSEGSPEGSSHAPDAPDRDQAGSPTSSR
jgi:RimJ/RimL family protein N-acetyltransferase